METPQEQIKEEQIMLPEAIDRLETVIEEMEPFVDKAHFDTLSQNDLEEFDESDIQMLEKILSFFKTGSGLTKEDIDQYKKDMLKTDKENQGINLIKGAINAIIANKAVSVWAK